MFIYKISLAQTDYVYIGSSSDPQRRFNEHRCRLRKKTRLSRRQKSLLANALPDDLTLTILEETTPARRWERESYWIARLGTLNSAIAAPGTPGVAPPEEAKLAASKRFLGKAKSPSHARKIGDALKRFWASPAGESLRANHRRKLTDGQVQTILDRHRNGETQKELAKVFGVSHSFVNQLCLGRYRYGAK